MGNDTLKLSSFSGKNYVKCFSFGPGQWARLISTEGFIGINGATPLTTIPGFTPWRPQAWNKIFKLSFAKCLAPQATYLLLLVEEILLICSLSHYLQSFIHPRWCRISAINSMKKNLTIFKFWHFPPKTVWESKESIQIYFTYWIWPSIVTTMPQHFWCGLTAPTSFQGDHGMKDCLCCTGGILNGVLKIDSGTSK